MVDIQNEWSTQLIDIIHEEWPTIDFKREEYSDGSISFSLSKKNIEVWMTSSNSEFSIGFNDSNNNCTWHTHMSLYGANTIQEQTDELKKQINQIIKSKTKIACSSKYGFWIASDHKENYKDDDEIIEYRTWEEL